MTNQFLLLITALNLGGKLKMKKENLSVSFVTQKRIGQKISPHKSSNNSVVDVAESLFVIDDETVWDEEVKID